MRRFIFTWLALMTFICGGAVQAKAEQIYALGTFGRDLVSFDSAAPGAVVIRGIFGLSGTDFFMGIDYRPADGQLYGITLNSQVFRINPLTGAATFVSTLSPTLSGFFTTVGLDFDPVADNLRVITPDLQNVRINVATGQVIRDPAISPGIPLLAGLAYTNNFAGATSTTLYGIGAAADSLYTIDPTTGKITLVGGLGVDVLDRFGFDISGESGIAYASLFPPGAQVPSLYRINLATGQATLVGQIGPGFALSINGLTVVPAGGSAIPEPATILLLGTGLAAVGAAVRHRRRARRSHEGNGS